MKAWQEQAKLKTDIEKKIADIKSEVKRLDAVIDTQAKALTEKQEKLEQQKTDLTEGAQERKQLYGDKKPDKEETRLSNAVTDAEKAEKKARDLNIALFFAALAPAGFADEKSFLENGQPKSPGGLPVSR